MFHASKLHIFLSIQSHDNFCTFISELNFIDTKLSLNDAIEKF